VQTTASRGGEKGDRNQPRSVALAGLERFVGDTQGSAFGSTLGYYPAPLRGSKIAVSWRGC
jgi:hypothetical protein